MAGNFISIDRGIMDWEWYKEPNTKVVFIHCLLKANWKDGRFKGDLIPRGSFVTSRAIMARELKLSEQSVRTAIKHLISTNEITVRTTNKYTVITVVKYDVYQNSDRHSTNNVTNNPTINQPTTNQQLTTIEQYNNITSINKDIEKPEKKRAVFTPPSVDEVRAYIQEKGYKVDAERFIDYYTSNGWKVGKNPMKDWKATVRNWARKDIATNPKKKDGFSNFTEREDTDWDNIELALLQRR